MTCLPCFRAGLDNEQDVELKEPRYVVCYPSMRDRVKAVLDAPPSPRPAMDTWPLCQITWKLQAVFPPRPHKCQWRKCLMPHFMIVTHWTDNTPGDFCLSYPLKREWRDNEFRGGRIYWVNVESNLTDKPL